MAPTSKKKNVKFQALSTNDYLPDDDNGAALELPLKVRVMS